MLTTLPNDICIVIFVQLPCRDLVALFCTSQILRGRMRSYDSIVWKHAFLRDFEDISHLHSLGIHCYDMIDESNGISKFAVSPSFCCRFADIELGGLSSDSIGKTSRMINVTSSKEGVDTPVAAVDAAYDHKFCPWFERYRRRRMLDIAWLEGRISSSRCVLPWHSSLFPTPSRTATSKSRLNHGGRFAGIVTSHDFVPLFGERVLLILVKTIHRLRYVDGQAPRPRDTIAPNGHEDVAQIAMDSPELQVWHCLDDDSRWEPAALIEIPARLDISGLRVCPRNSSVVWLISNRSAWRLDIPTSVLGEEVNFVGDRVVHSLKVEKSAGGLHGNGFAREFTFDAGQSVDPHWPVQLQQSAHGNTEMDESRSFSARTTLSGGRVLRASRELALPRNNESSRITAFDVGSQHVAMGASDGCIVLWTNDNDVELNRLTSCPFTSAGLENVNIQAKQQANGQQRLNDTEPHMITCRGRMITSINLFKGHLTGERHNGVDATPFKREEVDSSIGKDAARQLIFVGSVAGWVVILSASNLNTVGLIGPPGQVPASRRIHPSGVGTLDLGVVQQIASVSGTGPIFALYHTGRVIQWSGQLSLEGRWNCNAARLVPFDGVLNIAVRANLLVCLIGEPAVFDSRHASIENRQAQTALVGWDWLHQRQTFRSPFGSRVPSWLQTTLHVGAHKAIMTTEDGVIDVTFTGN